MPSHIIFYFCFCSTPPVKVFLFILASYQLITEKSFTPIYEEAFILVGGHFYVLPLTLPPAPVARIFSLKLLLRELHFITAHIYYHCYPLFFCFHMSICARSKFCLLYSYFRLYSLAALFLYVF